MPLFGKKNTPPSAKFQPEMPPSLSDADLAAASRLMDQWDASLGNSDATWNCIEAIAKRGGFGGAVAALTETSHGKAINDVMQRPWGWWNEAARLAQATGDDVLAGRIFLFTYLFTTTMVPKMRAVEMLDTGLPAPREGVYKSIAALAVSSLARLSPGLIIHNTATGQVDVENALGMAEQVSGVRAPQVDASNSEPFSDTGPFNTL